MGTNAQDSAYCRQQAEAVGRLAANTPLPMVKQNLLKAERAWHDMAVRKEAAEAEKRIR